VNVIGYLQTVEYINAWLGMENLLFTVLTWSKVRQQCYKTCSNNITESRWDVTLDLIREISEE